MTESMAAVDFSTYRLYPLDIWSGADETKKVERQESEKARLFNVMAGLAVTTLPVLMPHTGWATTLADYSIRGSGVVQLNFATSTPTTALPAPLRFLEAHYEMLSYKALEDGWDDVSSKGISADAVDAALAFLALLPPDVSAPEASASGDGTVDWYWRNGRYAATVTFYPSGRVAYFAMTDAGRVKDSFKFSGSIPGQLVASLRQL
jgi:hypothetical protein